MKPLFPLAMVALVMFSGCGDQGSSTSADDQERPVDWVADWEMMVLPDSTIKDRDVLKVVSFESDQSLNTLSDELFKMAFSGEAEVYATDLFGGMDESNQLDPKMLLEELKTMDTVVVEDIYTGQLKDTVVDNSFTAEKSSAMILTFSFDPKADEKSIKASKMALGVQVFDPITGKRRGDSKRFYLNFDQEDKNIDHLKLYTDSLGHFTPAYFEVYPDETNQSLKDWVESRYGTDQPVKLQMRVELSFMDGMLRVREARFIKPVQEPV